MGKIYDDDYNKLYDTYEKISAAVSVGSLLVGGIGKSIAGRNQKKAEEIYNSARDRYASSFQVFEESTQKTKKQ